METSTSAVLNRAADLIEQRGWTTGSGGTPAGGGPLCLEGALAAVVGARHHTEIWAGCPAYDAVHTYLGTRPYRWNDALPHDRVLAAINRGDHDLDLVAIRAEAHAKSAAEVVEVLRAAAVIEAAKETPRPSPEPDHRPQTVSWR